MCDSEVRYPRSLQDQLPADMACLFISKGLLLSWQAGTLLPKKKKQVWHSKRTPASLAFLFILFPTPRWRLGWPLYPFWSRLLVFLMFCVNSKIIVDQVIARTVCDSAKVRYPTGSGHPRVSLGMNPYPWHGAQHTKKRSMLFCVSFKPVCVTAS